MNEKFLQGQRTWCVGRLHCKETGRRNYYLRFRRNGRDIARLYYHSEAKQIVLRVDEGIDLTTKTLAVLIPFMFFDKFRIMRRYGQSQIRRLKVKARMETKDLKVRIK